MLTSANGLVTSITSANAALRSSLTQTQTQATGLINTINTTIDQIAALNGQIRAATAVGDNPNTYQDQRDQLIDKLSTYLPTSTAIQADGSTLVTVDGQALVNDAVAYHLATPVVGTNPNGTVALQVDFVKPPNPINPPAINITGGQLGGLLDTYNNKLIPYQNQLNDFANSMATEADRISQAGYDSTGTAGGQLFSPVVVALPISAGNLQVGILTPSEVPTSLATSAAGTLVKPLNAGNTTVDTTADIDKNATFANTDEPRGGRHPQRHAHHQRRRHQSARRPARHQGQLPDQLLDRRAAGRAGRHDRCHHDRLVHHHLQRPASGRDGLLRRRFATRRLRPRSDEHRSRAPRADGGGDPARSDDAGFHHHRQQHAASVPRSRRLGNPATGILEAFGGDAFNGVQQNSTNAIGVTNGADVTALQSLFSASFGVPALQTTSATAIAGPGVVTDQPGRAAGGVLPAQRRRRPDARRAARRGRASGKRDDHRDQPFYRHDHVHRGERSPGRLHRSRLRKRQPLQKYYANLVANMGQDTANATTGNTSQTSLSSNINQVRQSTDGINIDEETQNLVKFQNAYGAAAHVIDGLKPDVANGGQPRPVISVLAWRLITNAHRDEYDLRQPSSVDRQAVGAVSDRSASISRPANRSTFRATIRRRSRKP